MAFDEFVIEGLFSVWNYFQNHLVSFLYIDFYSAADGSLL